MTDNPEDKIGSWAPRTFGDNEWTRIDPLAGGVLSLFLAGAGLPVHRGDVRLKKPPQHWNSMTACQADAACNLHLILRPMSGCAAAITVNIGDLLMRFSDDKLKSTYHRVRQPGPEEFQVAVLHQNTSLLAFKAALSLQSCSHHV